MNNKELVEVIAKKIGRNKTDVQKLLDGLVTVLGDELSKLNTIVVPGFGSFEAKKKNERIVTNPSNGKRMLIPPKISMSYKVSNVLKNKIK